MRAEVFTIFPELVSMWAEASLIGKACRNGSIEVLVHDIRAAAMGPHRSVDDSPFGGGAGMVLAPEPIFAAVEAANPARPLYLLGPGAFVLTRRWPVNWRLARASRSCAGDMRASTNGWPSTWSMGNCPSATTFWREARRRPPWSSNRWPAWCRA